MITFADKLSLPEAILDLHDFGPIRDFEVEEIVNRFIEDSYHDGLKKVLIVTGKGLNSKSGPKLRPQVQKLLKQNKSIRTFHLASSARGGEGAIEVYLS
jgi:DNA-nicking Smr family endonuclease